jgi:hypothetical protein
MFEENRITNVKRQRKRKSYFGHNPPTSTTLPTELSHTVSPHNSKTSNADIFRAERSFARYLPFKTSSKNPKEKQE